MGFEIAAELHPGGLDVSSTRVWLLRSALECGLKDITLPTLGAPP